jgi:hypothetical protein
LTGVKNHFSAGREGGLNQRNGIGSTLPGANYTTLAPVRNRDQSQVREMQSALKDFLSRHPDLAADPRKLEVLQYCFKHYINFDPELRDLTIQEKLERANQMAVDFLGSMSKL